MVDCLSCLDSHPDREEVSDEIAHYCSKEADHDVRTCVSENEEYVDSCPKNCVYYRSVEPDSTIFLDILGAYLNKL